MSLCLIGIPIGIFCGYFGIAVTLNLTADLISGLLAGSTESGIDLHAVGSVPAFICAGVIAAVTVFLSVFIPAKRATKVAPIAAIRQTQDYQIPKKGLKSSKLTAKIWGLPGLMARKYYAVSKHKYRATVISLTISVVLFITSCGFTQVLQEVADSNANTCNFDMLIGGFSEEQLSKIRSHSAVQESALRTEQQWTAVIPKGIFTKEYQEACDIYNNATGYEDDADTKYVNIYYLEDDVFLAYLEEKNIAPEPYFDTQNPTALVMNSKITVYKQNANISERMIYETDVFNDTADSLFLYNRFIPDELSDYLKKIPSNYYFDSGVYRDYPITIYRFIEQLDESVIASTPYLQANGSLSVVTIPLENEDGTYSYAYYFYDPLNDTIAKDPIAVSDDFSIPPDVRLGATVSELPFGITNHSESEVISLVMPLSMVDTEDYPPNLLISVNNYEAITGYLDAEEIYYQDLLRSQMQYRNMVTMVNVFSYGFIILISLICVCNVFNTISTNIALRRRDFGMLRSVGMQTKELNRMMIFECLRYGVLALAMGLPMGVLLTFGIHTLTGNVGNSNYELPLIQMCIAIACVFVVVFISMVYALSRLKKDNPIEAIRMENL